MRFFLKGYSMRIPLTLIPRPWRARFFQIGWLALAGLLPPVLLAQPSPFPAAKTGGNYMHNFYLPPPAPSSPVWPCWSPDGQWLAFAMHGSIWRIKVGDTTAEELTDNPTYDSSPAWSPDGRWIVYTAEDDGKTIGLMILDVAAGTSAPLKTGPHLYLDPAWSPDGTRLAYVSTEPNGYFNIVVLPMKDGKAAGEPVSLTRDHAYGKSRLYFGDYDLHIEPSWSPDGKELLFVSNRGLPLGSGGIWRMPAGPNGIDNARLIHTEQTLYRTRPHWSPDGSRFVYSSHVGGQFNNLYLLPGDGGEPYKRTFGSWDSFHPRWSPDGTNIAFVSNQAGLPQLKVLEAVGGKITDVTITQKRWKRPHGTLNLRVIDAAAGQPTPARVYTTASNGKAYAPDNAYHRVGRLNEHFFHTDGTVTMQVPTGLISVEAMKGFEYRPGRTEIEIKAGTATATTITLSRLTDMPGRGWYSGSTHVHMNYGGDLHNTLPNLMLMSAAEDQSVVNELVANKDNRVLDYQFFTGKPDPISTPDRILYVSEEYRPAFHGHVYLLGLTDHLLSPFASGYEGTAIESPSPSNTDIFELAEKQKAFRGYVHPYGGENDPLAGPSPSLGGAKSFPVDAALGTVEGLELMSGANHAGYIVWHHLLNNDFKIVPTGGEDSISNLYRTAIVGQDRTYVYVGDEPLTWERWMDGIRKGHTFVTNGPLLMFSINGEIPGGEVRLPKGGGMVTLQADVQSIVPLDKAVIYCNGQVLETIPLSQDKKSATLKKQIRVTTSGWYTLQAEGKEPTHPIDDGYPQATTNAVRVYVGDQPIRSKASAAYFVRWIDALTALTAQQPGWRSQAEKDYVLGQFRQARAVYEKLAR
ncbi:MAG: CehA/McbA family metallohydrolase [Candidatus Latescibacteria bacterium]|nr:CehA/McbA family metallohydrolase [Candidatus Latescibacterota bacterium]